MKYISLFLKKIYEFFSGSKTKIATCVYLLDGDYVQMAQQKGKLIGFLGYGGKVKKGQTIRGNAIEELWEETGGKVELRINPEEEGGIFSREDFLIPVGKIDFYNGENVPKGRPSFRVYFFVCKRYEGRSVDTVEMVNHQLFNRRNLPLESLVKGDELFIPKLLNNQPLVGSVRRSSDWEVISNDLRPATPKDLDF